VLAARRAHAPAFGAGPAGAYAPLAATGACDGHVVAFSRGAEVVTVVPRLVMGLGGPPARWDWQGTTLALPDGRWTDVLADRSHAGGDVPLADLLGTFPVALLVRAGG
jgi:(1->4)-alpha-D-glucan 1-alpha-D-glucosylmutase